MRGKNGHLAAKLLLSIEKHEDQTKINRYQVQCGSNNIRVQLQNTVKKSHMYAYNVSDFEYNKQQLSKKVKLVNPEGTMWMNISNKTCHPLHLQLP